MLVQLSTQGGAALVFASVLATTAGLPVPAMPTLIVVTASLIARQGQDLPALTLLFLAATIGALLGDNLWFRLGARFGVRTLKLLCRVSLSRDSCVRQTERFMVQWGVRALAVAKFIPGLSMVTVPLAGAMKVRWRTFIVYDAIGIVLWVAAGMLVGALFTAEVDAVLAVLSETGRDALLIGAVLLLLYIAFRWWRRRSLLRDVAEARITVDELYAMMATPPAPVLLDVRSSNTRALDPYRIPGARVVDLRGDTHWIGELDRQQPLVVYCACPNEVSAAELARRLRQQGFRRVHVLQGGLDAWRAAGRLIDADAQHPPLDTCTVSHGAA